MQYICENSIQQIRYIILSTSFNAATTAMTNHSYLWLDSIKELCCDYDLNYCSHAGRGESGGMSKLLRHEQTTMHKITLLMFYSYSLYPLHHHSHIMHVASSYSNMFYLENSCTFPVFLLLVCVSHELLVEYQQEIYTKLLYNNGFVMWLQFHMYTHHGLVLKLSSEKLKRESLWWSLATSMHTFQSSLWLVSHFMVQFLQ